jgi:hypothetical protein
VNCWFTFAPSKINNPMNLADHIERIAKEAEESHLDASKMKTLSPNLKKLADVLKCSREQAFMFALIFYQSLERGSVDFGDLARHIDIPVMRLLKYKADIDQLVKNRLVRQENRNTFSQKPNLSFYIPRNVIDGTLKSRLTLSSDKINDNFDFVIRVAEMMQLTKEDSGSFETLKEDFQDLCHENSNLFIAQKLIGSNIPENEILMLVFAVYKLMNGEEDVSLSEACEFLESNKSFQLSVRRTFLNGNNAVIKRGFIEMKNGMFRNDSELNVTDSGLQFLMGEESEKFMIRSERNKRELTTESIPPVTLFYNDEESRQLKTVEGLLDAAKFSEMSKRMRDMKMKAGFTVLLYGNPGTGKTESVYQLARLTGRSIIPIEISQTKSMWFGESEKLIRDVFQSYKKLNESSKTSPILLFNEADGIFGKRTTHMDSAVSQTLNAMQNIILQEMEDFEGIMMATTNLTDNLDKAFDRRFLYKIKFENPTFDTRIEIMRDKFPFLKLEAVRQLCEHFSLTGGQMANIAKKCSIHELLNGQLPEPDEISAFCRDEQGLTEKRKLGF